MKQKIILFSIFLLMVGQLVFSSGNSTEVYSAGDLDGNAIDLLVGTPDGVEEPLDTRRSRPVKTIDYDFSKFLTDLTFDENISADFSWQDAEEAIGEDDAETECIKDLIDEIEDFEAQTNNDYQEYSEYVETEPKL